MVADHIGLRISFTPVTAYEILSFKAEIKQINLLEKDRHILRFFDKKRHRS